MDIEHTERQYHHDARFRAAVTYLEHAITQLKLTPSELRAAAAYAALRATWGVLRRTGCFSPGSVEDAWARAGIDGPPKDTTVGRQPETGPESWVRIGRANDGKSAPWGIVYQEGMVDAPAVGAPGPAPASLEPADDTYVDRMAAAVELLEGLEGKAPETPVVLVAPEGPAPWPAPARVDVPAFDAYDKEVACVCGKLYALVVGRVRCSCGTDLIGLHAGYAREARAAPTPEAARDLQTKIEHAIKALRFEPDELRLATYSALAALLRSEEGELQRERREAACTPSP